MSKENDLNNYLSAEYWRLKYFSSKRKIVNLWMLIALLTFWLILAIF